MSTQTIDIYNYDRKLANSKKRLDEDERILKKNKETIRKFLDSRVSRGLSVARVLKYSDQFVVIGRCCKKPFERMTKDDVMHLLVELKEREKPAKTWAKVRGKKYSENSMGDIRTMMKVFWRWLKAMDESKKEYPPEVSWFTKGKTQSITVTRAELLSPKEIDDLASVTGDAQDNAFVKVLEDAGGRVAEILTLRTKDVERTAYGFKLNIEKSKTFLRGIPVVRSAPALAQWLAVHPYREDDPNSPLWLDTKNQPLTYAAARKRLMRIVAFMEKKNGKRFGKRVWMTLFRHSSATDFMKKQKGSQGIMNKKFGWSPSSRMAATYSHLIDEDVEEAIVKADADPQTAANVASKLEQKKPRRCLRCDNVNDASGRYCSKCAFPLDVTAAAEAIQAEEQKSEAESILNLLIKDDRVQEAIRTVMGELSTKRISAQISSSAVSPSQKPGE